MQELYVYETHVDTFYHYTILQPKLHTPGLTRVMICAGLYSNLNQDHRIARWLRSRCAEWSLSMAERAIPHFDQCGLLIYVNSL